MNKIDLHLHSYYSDGQLSPFDLLKNAKKAGNRLVALTDHNGISGLEEAKRAAKKLGIQCLAGVEFYSIYKKRRLHILGYSFNSKNKNLANLICLVQKKHQDRVSKILANAEKMGFIVNRAKLNKTKSVYLGWSEIINNLKLHPRNRKIFNRTIGPKADLFDIINRYFSFGKRGYVPPIDWPAPNVIKTLKKAGAVVILAHPGQQLTWNDDQLIVELKKLGVQGLEVFSPYHEWHQILHYQRMAQDLKMIMTGGTDYHGDILDKRLKIKKQWDYFTIPDSIYKEGLGKLIKK